MFGGTWEPKPGCPMVEHPLSAPGPYCSGPSWTTCRTVERRHGPCPASSIALAIVLGLSGSAIFAFLGGVLSAAIAGVWVASWRGTGINLSRGVVPPFVVVHVGLILSGLFYADVPRVSACAGPVGGSGRDLDRPDRAVLPARWPEARIPSHRGATHPTPGRDRPGRALRSDSGLG